MIKVLVVEDSPVVREFLVHILGSAPGIDVIGTAADGEEALEKVEAVRPDVITMDINMPGMDGLEATRRIMESHPVPIVIVSGNWDPGEVETTFRAMEAGALAIVQRPKGIGHPGHETSAAEMVNTVRLMSEVKVVRRWVYYRKKTEISPGAVPAPVKMQGGVKVVAIGASTGGPVVLRNILGGLNRDFRAPVMIVQHMAAGFLKGMLEWLAETSGMPLHIAEDGAYLLPGHAYFAPDGYNMGADSNCRISLSGERAEHGAMPSASYLFRSVARSFGDKAVGVLLSGMGRDGAEELRLMKDNGAVTIAQDRESSVIYGMPGAAVELGAVSYVLSPEKIITALKSLTGTKDNI